MKKMTKRLVFLALALVLALTQTVSAEESGLVKGIFDALTAEGSYYRSIKETDMGNADGARFEETLDGDSFTITISGTDSMDGSWTFTKEGDFLNATMDATDIFGRMLSIAVLRAAGDYYGINGKLLTGYIAGMSVLGLENPYFRFETDEKEEKQKAVIYIAAPFEMAELEQMVATEEIVERFGFEPFGTEYMTRMFNLGRITMMMNGSADNATILLLEYGDLDEAAYQSVIGAVSAMKPDGWEAFVKEFTELKNAEGEGWSVQLNADEETVREIVPEPYEGYSNIVIRFGARETGTEGNAAETEENTAQEQDFQYVLYVGTNDKDTNTPVLTQEEALERTIEILLKHFGGYTVQEAHGGWISDGKQYREYTLVIYLSDTDIDSVHAAADELLEAFHQSTVLIQKNETHTEFYSPEK